MENAKAPTLTVTWFNKDYFLLKENPEHIQFLREHIGVPLAVTSIGYTNVIDHVAIRCSSDDIICLFVGMFKGFINHPCSEYWIV